MPSEKLASLEKEYKDIEDKNKKLSAELKVKQAGQCMRLIAASSPTITYTCTHMTS